MRKISAHTLLLLAVIMIASIAAMPATLAKPPAPTARATGNPGEITISWGRIQGAEYYTVGWINWTRGRNSMVKARIGPACSTTPPWWAA